MIVAPVIQVQFQVVDSPVRYLAGRRRLRIDGEKMILVLSMAAALWGFGG
jgi:hypothetical protein